MSLDVDIPRYNANNEAVDKNSTDNFINQIKEIWLIDRSEEMNSIDELLNETFFKNLEKWLHPDDALQLRSSIVKIDGYKDNQQLNKLYNFVDRICNSFSKNEHENIDENMRFDINNYLNQNIKNSINICINELEEKNFIVQDNNITNLIIAIRGIFKWDDISWKSLLKIADYLGISLKDDEKYDKQGRLNRLWKKIFWMNSNSLLMKLLEEYKNIEEQYKEKLIPTIFNDDFLLENQFLQYSPAMSWDISGEIEFRERTNIIKDPNKENEERMELWIFDREWNLLEWTRKEPNKIKSWIFENWNLKEWYIINKSNNILIWAFNYNWEQKTTDTKPDGTIEIVDDALDGIIRWKWITYNPSNHNIEYIDKDNQIHYFTKYTYNNIDNTITLNIKDDLQIPIKRDWENWEKLVFDYLVQYDPMNCIDDSITIQPANSSTTIFQQFCENNWINYVNTKNDIQRWIESINNENFNILKNIDIINLLSITKWEVWTFNCNGTYKISDNNIQERYEIDWEQKWNNCDNNPLISGLTWKWADFSTLGTEELWKLSEENKKLWNLKFENRTALEKFIIEKDLARTYINQIKEFLGAPNNETPPEVQNDPENPSNNTEHQGELSDINPNQITNLRSWLSPQTVADFLNNAIKKQDINDEQKNLLLLAQKWLTTGEKTNDDIKQLQSLLWWINADWKFGIKTFNALLQKFGMEQLSNPTGIGRVEWREENNRTIWHIKNLKQLLTLRIPEGKSIRYEIDRNNWFEFNSDNTCKWKDKNINIDWTRQLENGHIYVKLNTWSWFKDKQDLLIWDQNRKQELVRQQEDLRQRSQDARNMADKQHSDEIDAHRPLVEKLSLEPTTTTQDQRENLWIGNDKMTYTREWYTWIYYFDDNNTLHYVPDLSKAWSKSCDKIALWMKTRTGNSWEWYYEQLPQWTLNFQNYFNKLIANDSSLSNYQVVYNPHKKMFALHTKGNKTYIHLTTGVLTLLGDSKYSLKLAKAKLDCKCETRMQFVNAGVQWNGNKCGRFDTIANNDAYTRTFISYYTCMDSTETKLENKTKILEYIKSNSTDIITTQ